MTHSLTHRNPARQAHGFSGEFLYLCTSEQVAGVVKGGMTGRDPEKRAEEFSDITGVVVWTPRLVFPCAPGAMRTAEGIAKLSMDGSGFQRSVNARTEQWFATLDDARPIWEHAAKNTPGIVHAKRPQLSSAVCRVPGDNEAGWDLTLSLPVRLRGLAQVSLGQAMALSVNPSTRHAAESSLRRLGVDLVRYDESRPRFRLYADSDSRLTRWLATLDLCWASLGCEVGGSLAVTFTVESQPGCIG